MNNTILCVNVDHIATLRQARGGTYPDPVEGGRICELNGAGGITIHLREDRRHIQDRDVIAMRDVVVGKFNLEMAMAPDVVELALKVVPDQVTLVPERREEVTTEGGLDVGSQFKKIRELVDAFHKKNILVSLFIEGDEKTVNISRDTGSDYVEFHTGAYCNATDDNEREHELKRIFKAAELALDLGLGINAGHGLNVWNLKPVMKCPGLEELNIGHSIISRSIFLGLPAAVKEILDIIAFQQ